MKEFWLQDFKDTAEGADKYVRDKRPTKEDAIAAHLDAIENPSIRQKLFHYHLLALRYLTQDLGPEVKHAVLHRFLASFWKAREILKIPIEMTEEAKNFIEYMKQGTPIEFHQNKSDM